MANLINIKDIPNSLINIKFAIEGSINGQWSRAHVGDVNDTTLFDSEHEAAEAVNDLVGAPGWTYETLRVVEVAS